MVWDLLWSQSFYGISEGKKIIHHLQTATVWTLIWGNFQSWCLSLEMSPITLNTESWELNKGKTREGDWMLSALKIIPGLSLEKIKTTHIETFSNTRYRGYIWWIPTLMTNILCVNLSSMTFGKDICQQLKSPGTEYPHAHKFLQAQIHLLNHSFMLPLS